MKNPERPEGLEAPEYFYNPKTQLAIAELRARVQENEEVLQQNVQEAMSRLAPVEAKLKSLASSQEKIEAQICSLWEKANAAEGEAHTLLLIHISSVEATLERLRSERRAYARAAEGLASAIRSESERIERARLELEALIKKLEDEDRLAGVRGEPKIPRKRA